MKVLQMPEKIDIDHLSQKYIELWQSQLEKALSDPLLQKSGYEMMSQFQEMMKKNVSSTAPSFFQSDQSETDACAASSSFNDNVIANIVGSLTERITACEKRLEQFESFLRSFQSKAS